MDTSSGKPTGLRDSLAPHIPGAPFVMVMPSMPPMPNLRSQPGAPTPTLTDPLWARALLSHGQVGRKHHQADR